MNRLRKIFPPGLTRPLRDVGSRLFAIIKPLFPLAISFQASFEVLLRNINSPVRTFQRASRGGRQAIIARTVLISLSVLVAGAFSAIPAFAQKKVLIVSSFDMRAPAIAIYYEAIRKTFASNDERVQIYTEALDDARIPQARYEGEFLRLLKTKYGAEKFECIFAFGTPALKLLLDHESDLFTNVPRVFLLVDERALAGLDLGKNTTGVSGKLQFGPTLEIILAQNPGIRTVAVVTGIAPLDISVLDAAKKEFATYEGRVDIQYLSDQTIPELRRQLADLPKDSVVYFLSYSADHEGNTYTYPESASLIVPFSSVPVYGTVDTGMGTGIVGGNLLSFESHGEIAAQLEMRIIAGESPAEIPPVTAPNVTMFDWRQLHRWNIDEGRLPAGSIVQFREPTFWEQYRPYVFGGLALLIFQSVLITWLLIIRARRRTAEHERAEFRSLAVAEHSRLNDVVSNVPGIVWESRAVNGAGERRVQFVSGYVEEMLGYSVDECMAYDDFLFSKIVEEDRNIVKQEAETVLMHGTPVTVQFRCVAKNGAVKWAESHVVAVRDKSGKPVGRRGVTMDITERKKAEENLRTKERQLTEAQRLAQVGSWEWDSATDTVTWSDEIYRIYGLDPSGPAVSYAEHSKLMTPESWQRLKAAVEEALGTGKSYELELELIHTDGRHLWASGRGEVESVGSGKMLRGTLQDITERKLAEESLKKALREINELKNEIHEENIHLKEMIKIEHDYHEIIGTSDALKYVLFKIEQVAPTDTTVLITGETGTGKDLVAHAIHRNSLRKDRPLVSVNCAALAPTLIESELFGHERGAFTGAGARKIGRFELADGGTIFLDEVGELPQELQAKLLRLIQEGEFERLGSSKTLTVDVRIMAATNRNLEAEVRKGRFREDLLFRLNVFPITVPPLRDRRQDVPLLVEYFVGQFAKKLGKSITSVSPTTMRSLMRYDWPGNIRELANVIERAVIGTSGDVLQLAELPGADKKADVTADSAQSLEAVERNHIIRTLLNTGWRVDGPQGAARILGINPSTLRTRMNKLGIVKSTHVH